VKQPLTDTEIPCQICKGSKINPSHGQPCGACGGCGLSTAPYDQRRNGTTTGVRFADDIITEDKLRALPELSNVEGLHIHHFSRNPVDRRLVHVLISWPNPHYDTQKALLCGA
jgi:hypothetical protein